MRRAELILLCTLALGCFEHPRPALTTADCTDEAKRYGVECLLRGTQSGRREREAMIQPGFANEGPPGLGYDPAPAGLNTAHHGSSLPPECRSGMSCTAGDHRCVDDRGRVLPPACWDAFDR